MNNESNQEEIYKIYAETADYYHSLMLSPCGETALDYLFPMWSAFPDVLNDTIKALKLGCTDNRRDGLVKHLQKLGYSSHLIQLSGLAGIDNSNELVDILQNNAVFPVIEENTRVIGFIGINIDDRVPVFKTTPETHVLGRNSSFYGIDHAIKTTSDYWILCDDCMQVVELYQNGFHNAISNLGTDLTKEHARKIRKHVQKVCLCYHRDASGQRKVQNARITLEEAGIITDEFDFYSAVNPF